MAKDAYYFPHDSNAKDDPKCVMLIEELQLEGYGIYWILIETLREQPNFKYPMKLIPALARRYFTTKEKMTAVIMGYDLFEIEGDEFFYSESLLRRMEIVNEKREKSKLAGKRSGEVRRLKALTSDNIKTDDEQMLNGCSADVEQKVNNKRKEKEKENNNNKNTLVCDDEFERFWMLYDKKVGKPVCIKKWNKISNEDKELIFKNLPAYIKSTPDKKYRKDPATWLNQECWNDELIDRSKAIGTSRDDNVIDMIMRTSGG